MLGVMFGAGFSDKDLSRGQMRISALTPQFVIEPPAGQEDSDQAKTVDDLKRLKLVQPEASEGAASEDSLDQQTKEGLKRLTKLVKEEKKKKRENIVSALEAGDRRKRRALRTYRDVSEARDPREGKGENIDETF